MTNSKAKISKYGTININISDHNAIFFNRKVHPSKPVRKIITGRTYAQYNEDRFLRDLQNIEWRDITAMEKPSDKWCSFKKRFIDICDVHAPTKKLKVTQNKPKWLTNDIFELMNVSDTAFKKAKTTKTSRDWEIAKDARNHLNRSILKAKKDCMVETLKLIKNNNNKIWSKLKEH